MADRVKNKVILITGAASGLGAATAKRLAEENAIVIVTARNENLGNKITEEIKQQNLHAHFMLLDVTNEENWITVMTNIEQQFGQLDVLINNAAMGFVGPVTTFSLADWRRMMAVNLDGTFLGTKHAIPLMAKSGGGSIINISSIDGLNGVPEGSAYGASKGGVCAFTRAVAIECAQAQNNIRVNALCPGSFHSPMVEKDEEWKVLVAESGGLENAKKIRASAIPLRRLATFNELTSGILFLASDESSYMLGTELIIDGGITAQ